jgi:hypothetical protein
MKTLGAIEVKRPVEKEKVGGRYNNINESIGDMVNFNKDDQIHNHEDNLNIEK